MNKSDLVDALASASGMTKADASRAVDAMFSPSDGIIAGALRGGHRVQITGFGTFEVKHRKAVWVATLAQGSRFISPRATVLRSRLVRV